MHVAFVWIPGYWRTCNCGQEYQFICKRSQSSPVNTTAAPTVPPKGGCPLKWTKFDSKVRNHSTWKNIFQPLFLSPKQMSDVKYNLQFSLKYPKMLEEKIHRWNNSRALQKTLKLNFLWFWLIWNHLLSVKCPPFRPLAPSYGALKNGNSVDSGSLLSIHQTDLLKVNKVFMFCLQCYSIITDRVASWEDARKQCITIGGNLVSIPTRRIQGSFCISTSTWSITLLTLTGKVNNTDHLTRWLGQNILQPLWAVVVKLYQMCSKKSTGTQPMRGSWVSKACCCVWEGWKLNAQRGGPIWQESNSRFWQNGVRIYSQSQFVV